MGIKRKPVVVDTGKEWLDNDGAFRFGKYRGQFVGDVAHDNPGYLSWVVKNVDDMDDDDFELITTWLERVT